MTSASRNKLIAAIIGLVLMCIGANVKVEMGSRVVPFILSDGFAVLIPIVAGWRWGSLAIITYLILGIVGLPVFADGGSGWEHFSGSGGGYLVGYLLAAQTSALIINNKYEWYLNLAAAVAGYIVIFTFGVGWIYLSTEMDLLHAYRVGLRPFWGTAALKIFSIWILGAIIVPRIDPPLFRE